MVCDDCGFPIVKIVTTALTDEEPASASVPAVISEPSATHIGTVILSETSDVSLEVVGFAERIAIAPNHRTVLGRSETNGSNVPDIDLTPFGAFEKGVSRTHAALIRQDSTLTLLDLGSSNGTLINGRRISANQPRVVQDGDEITFGQLVARVYFK